MHRPRARCGGGGRDPQFARWSLWMDEVFNFKQMVVWDKGPMGMGWHYRRSYETVLVGEKPGAACLWYGGSNTENIIRPGNHGICKIIPKSNEHPCAKPVELYRFFVDRHTKPGDVVVDAFMGEAPCGVACIRGGRRFVGVECDPHWYAMAHHRILREWELYQGGPLFTPKADELGSLFEYRGDD
jgi:site-specific DNA-methyltransferase (adenine-specific)